MNILVDKTVLFIDLDGTLIKTASGNTFPKDCTDFIIRKEVLDKLPQKSSLQQWVIRRRKYTIFQIKSLSLTLNLRNYTRGNNNIFNIPPRHLPMAWGFSLLTVQIVDDFSVRLVNCLVVVFDIDGCNRFLPYGVAQCSTDCFE